MSGPCNPPTRPRPRTTATRSRRSSPSTSRRAGRASAHSRPRGAGAVRPRLAPHALRARLPRRRLAGRVRRRGAVGARAGDPRRGVGPGRCADRRAERHLRHQDARQHAACMWGTDEQKAHYLPAHPVAARTCGARATPSPTPGPTSASLGCRAVLDGDEWVINGQKVWTSPATSPTAIFVARPHRPRRAEAPGHLVPPVPTWTSPASRCGRSR